MSADTIMAYISDCSHTGRLELRVCVQCAPVLKGIKASNLITVAKGSLKMLKQAMEGTGITCVSLFSGERTDVLLLFRRQMLGELLKQEDVRNFLKDCGYGETDLPSVLVGLRRAYMAFSSGEADFPHELGVILEYPVPDVIDFIRYKGEQFLFTGYWKVYHDPEQARIRFRQYDKAREMAVQQIIDGRSLREVAER